MAVINPLFIQTLMLLYTRLKGSNVCWAITGSMGMAIQGMDVEINDIDLQSDREGTYEIQNLFPEYITERVELKEGATIRSYFGRMNIMGVGVELMGDMEHREPGSDWKGPLDLSCYVRWVEFEEMNLPVLDLEHEYVAYQRLGRPEKAAKIRAFLDQRRKEAE